MSRKRVLILSEVVPFPPTNGKKIPVYQIMRRLGRKHDLHMLMFHEADESLTVKQMEALRDICTIRGIYRANTKTIWHMLKNITDKDPLSLVPYRNHEAMMDLRDILSEEAFDVVHLFGYNVGHYVIATGSVPTIFAPNDCVSLAYEESAEFRGFSWARRAHLKLQIKKLQKYEQHVLENVAAAYVTTETDKQALSRVNLDAIVEVIPVGVGIDQEFLANYKRRSQRPTLMTSGVSAARDGVSVTWFHRHVYPKIKAEIPDVRFLIVGKNPTARIQELARRDSSVVVTGYVPKLEPYFGESDVYIAPLRTATGIQNRLLEAMAAGLPSVVMRSVVARMEVSAGEHVFIADEPSKFATVTVRLLRDAVLRSRIGDAAQALVNTRYTWDSVVADMEELYERVRKGEVS